MPGMSPQQQCLNEEQKPSVAHMDPTIPLNLDDRRLVLLAIVVRFLPILLAVLMCVGCHEHGTYSNVTKNSTKNVGKSKLAGTPGLGSLQQSSAARMDPTIPLN